MTDRACDMPVRTAATAEEHPSIEIFQGQMRRYDANGQAVGLFSSVQHVVEPGPGGGYTVVRRREPIDGPGVRPPRPSALPPGTAWPRANAGLVDAAILHAATRGVRLTIRRSSPRPLPLPVPEAVGQLLGWPPTPHVLNAVRANPRLIVRHGQGVSPAKLVAEMLQTMPGIRVAVCCPHRVPREAFMSELRSIGCRHWLATTDCCPEWNRALVICSWAGASHPTVELSNRHLLIFPAASDAIAAESELMLLDPDARFGVVGFQPAGRRAAPREQDLLAAVFGFRQTEVPAHGSQPRVVEVAEVANPIRIASPDRSMVSAAKRQLIWGNGGRNTLVAKLSRALASGDLDRVCGRFPDIEGRIDHLARRRIAVVAENVEHLAELAMSLSGWPIRTADHVDLGGLPPKARRAVERGRARRLPRNVLLCTPGGLATQALCGGDIIVDAAAGPGPMPFVPKQLRCPSGSDERLLLIDVCDQHPALLARWASERRRQCIRNGWVPAGTPDPTEWHYKKRILEFLHRQERGS